MAARRGWGDSQDPPDLLEWQVGSIAKVDRQALALWQGLNRLPYRHAVGVAGPVDGTGVAVAVAVGDELP